MDISVAIIAYNAQATLARTLNSILQHGPVPVVLIDDGSTDGTTKIAAEFHGLDIKIVRGEQNSGTGSARSLALKHIETKYAVWLDADDAFCGPLPRLVHDCLEGGNVDLVFFGANLLDGEDGSFIRRLDIPKFVRDSSHAARVFERNWFPVLTMGFDVSFARWIDFDTSLHSAEDYGFLLNSIKAGARTKSLEGHNYNYYHYGNSTSRNRSKTQASTKEILEKFSYVDVEGLLKGAGAGAGETNCILASMALNRQEYEMSLQYGLSVAGKTSHYAYGISYENVGKYIAATAHLCLGNDADALKSLDEVLGDLGQEAVNHDALNNKACALWKLGETSRARALLDDALRAKPDFYDAKMNSDLVQNDRQPTHVTLLPLRRENSRDQY